MRDSKPVHLLKTLSDEEMKAFVKFISSPYFNSVKKLGALLEILKKFHPDYSSGYLDYEKIHARLFKGKRFSKQVMWNLSSQLEKKLREFLAQQTLRSDPVLETELTLKAFGSRKLLNNFPQALEEMENMLAEKGIDYDHFEKRMHLENLRQDYFHLADRVKEMGNSKLKASEYQILLFLRMAIGSLNDLILLKRDYNYTSRVELLMEFIGKTDLRSVTDYAKKSRFEYAYLIEIYYHSLMLFLEPREREHLGKIRELFRTHYEKFAVSEKRNIMHWIVNYCFAKLSSDEINLRRIIFDINKLRLKDGIAFYPEDQLPKALYFQFLNNALALGEHGWAGEFIKTYSVRLNADIRKPAVLLANALLSFSTKEFRKAMDYLHKTEAQDILSSLTIRSLTARSFYELNETEALLSYIDSSVHFMNNNRSISTAWRIPMLKFFKCLKKIVKLKEKKDYSQAVIIRKEIDSIPLSADRKWLLEKLNELEKI